MRKGTGIWIVVVILLIIIAVLIFFGSGYRVHYSPEAGLQTECTVPQSGGEPIVAWIPGCSPVNDCTGNNRPNGCLCNNNGQCDAWNICESGRCKFLNQHGSCSDDGDCSGSLVCCDDPPGPGFTYCDLQHGPCCLSPGVCND